MKRSVALLSALLLLPVDGLPNAPQQEPAVRVTTRLVLVSVVVKDKKGQPVTDLARDDFTLLDEGQPQPISVFTRHAAQVETAPAPLPEHTYTNRPEYTSHGLNSVTVILLDNLNTRLLDRVYVRQEVVKFLQQVRPDDRVALYVLGMAGLRVLHNFTSDARPLHQALTRYWGAEWTHADQPAPEKSDTGDPEKDAYFDAISERVADFYEMDRRKRTARALRAIASHLAPFPGRKNLVWVTHAFPFPGDMASGAFGVRREIEEVISVLNGSNITVYSVDAHGLVVGMEMLPRGTGRGDAPATTFNRQNLRRTTPLFNLRKLNLSQDTMIAFSQGTGGRAFYNTNDISGAIRRAIDDAAFTYLLGYYPTHSQWDGNFRKIRVAVKRKGIQLRHRSGYFTLLPSAQPSDAEARTKALQDEVLGPLRPAAISMNVQVEPVRVAGTASLKLHLNLEATHLSLEESNGRWTGLVDVMFAQLYGEKKTAHHATQTLEIGLNRESYEEVMRNGLHATKLLELLPDAEELIIVVRDVRSGTVGTVSIPLGCFLDTAPAP